MESLEQSLCRRHSGNQQEAHSSSRSTDKSTGVTAIDATLSPLRKFASLCRGSVNVRYVAANKAELRAAR